MTSTIAGQALFNSGPHRFVIERVGTLFVPPLTFDPVQTTTEVIEPIELAIVQSGRLIGADNDDLWDQVETIRAQAEIPLNGELIDNNGRSWSDMTLLQFSPADRVERGRVISLAYTVHYIRLAG